MRLLKDLLRRLVEFCLREVLECPRVRPLTARQAYVRARYRESRDSRGRLSFLQAQDGIALIAELPLIDVAAGNATTVASAVR